MKDYSSNRKILEQALESFKKNLFEQAVNYFNLVEKIPEKYFELVGVSYYKCGRYREALQYFLKALKNDRNNPFLLNKTGASYQETGDFMNAEKYYKESLKDSSDTGIFNFNLALLYQKMGRFDDAETLFLKANKLEPDNPDYIFQLAVTFHKKNETKKALENYYSVIRLNPDYADAYFNLSIMYQELHQPEKALHYQLIALDISEKEPRYHNNLGNIYYNQYKLNEAFKHHQKAMELFPHQALYHYNLGLSLQNLGQYESALKSFETAVSKDPKNAKYHYSFAFMLLFTGNYSKGWREFEWRFAMKEQKPRFIKKNNYRQVSLDKAGKVFIYAEQGYGDTFMFLRYLPLLKKQGKYLIFECQKGLKELLKNTPYLDEVYEITEHSVTSTEFDVSIPLLSLPVILNTSEIPASIPYISAVKNTAEKWQKELSFTKEIKIGFAWEPGIKSNTHWKRVCPLKYFIELSSIQGIKMFSLQKGDTTEKLVQAHENIIDLSDRVHNFSDTAAIIANLDLVITVDTSVAHLAAAMGKKTFIMLPFSPDWRWSDFNGKLWYPHVELFRQAKAGDWETVFEEIRQRIMNYEL